MESSGFDINALSQGALQLQHHTSSPKPDPVRTESKEPTAAKELLHAASPDAAHH